MQHLLATLFIFSLSVAALPTLAKGGSGGGSSASSSLGKLGRSLLRFGVGYGFTEIKNQTPSDSITEFQKPRHFWQDADFPLPISAHIGFRQQWDDAVQVDFSGGGSRPGQIYMTNVLLGFKATLPFWRIQPWAGIGVVGGFLTVSNPDNRNLHNVLVVFDKETRAVRGTYLHSGVDLAVLPGMGFRFGYQWEKINTDKFDHLEKTAVNLSLGTFIVGIVGNIN